jgi:glycosyltransferase involved in cell wall biosynthesis
MYRVFTISLIIPTLGKTDKLLLLLESLEKQIFKNFDLLIIDQSDNYGVKELAMMWRAKLNIKYIHSNKKGLSYNRNLGLAQAKGGIIGFPDDDCFYASDTLSNVNNFFKQHTEFSILSGKQVDPKTRKTHQFVLRKSREIYLHDVFNAGNSITIFLKRPQQQPQLLFDEKFGIGAPFGGAEETDYIFRLLESHKKGYYSEDVIIYHKISGFDEMTDQKTFYYAMGTGAFFRKEFRYLRCFSLFFSLILFKGIIGTIMAGITFNKIVLKYRLAKLRGYFFGFFKYRKSVEDQENSRTIV